MEYPLTKADWKKAKVDNINLIKQCDMQILMANRILLLCDEQINECIEADKIIHDNYIDADNTTDSSNSSEDSSE